MKLPLPLPSTPGEQGDFARHLATLLGTAYQARDGSVVAAEMLAWALGLLYGRQANLNSVAEAFGDSASSLLSELETMYGLLVRADLSTSDRQTRLVAKIRAARAGSPTEIERAVKTLDSSAKLYENQPGSVPREADQLYWPGTERHTFVWSVRVTTAAWASPTLRPQIDAIVEQMKPAYTRVFIHTNDPFQGFKLDDATCLLDRDVFGS